MVSVILFQLTRKDKFSRFLLKHSIATVIFLIAPTMFKRTMQTQTKASSVSEMENVERVFGAGFVGNVQLQVSLKPYT